MQSIVDKSKNLYKMYRFSFNGQERDDEITNATGSHNTALFWEYDTRLGRRWNLDPKPQISISDYACFGNGPIWFSDRLGDKIRTSEEGNKIFQEGLNATLGENNPFGYNAETGLVTYNDAFNRTNYSNDQLRLIEDVAAVVNHNKTTTIHIVDFDEPLPFRGLSLHEHRFSGAKTNDGLNVYIASNPQVVGKVDNPQYNPLEPMSRPTMDGMVPDKPETRGVSVLHEVAGHVFLRFTQPQLSHNNHDFIVEHIETFFRQFYKIGVYETKSEVKKANNSGLNVRIGDNKYLGGVALPHAP